MSVTVSNRIETRNVRKSQKFFQKFQQQIELASNHNEPKMEGRNAIMSNKVASARREVSEANPKSTFTKSLSFTANLTTNAHPTMSLTKNANDPHENYKQIRLNSSLTNVSFKTNQSDNNHRVLKMSIGKSIKSAITTVDDAEKSLITNNRQITNLQLQRQNLLKKQQQEQSQNMKNKLTNDKSQLPVFNKSSMKQSTSTPSVSSLIKPFQSEQHNDGRPILSKSLISKIENAKQKSSSHSNGIRNKVVPGEVTQSADSAPDTVVTTSQTTKKQNKIPVYVNLKYTSLIRQKQHKKLHTTTTIPE
jgi:hypothetical protein